MYQRMYHENKTFIKKFAFTNTQKYFFSFKLVHILFWKRINQCQNGDDDQNIYSIHPWSHACACKCSLLIMYERGIFMEDQIL